MLADPSYDAADLVLSPRDGAVVGAISALVMLGVLAIFRPASHLTVNRVVAVLAPGEGGAAREAVVGVALHLCVGAALGLLYSVCQQRAPKSGYIAVGVFYGVVISVGSRLASRWLFSSAVHGLVTAWPWVLATIVYGIGLGVGAVVLSVRRPPTAAPALD